MFSQRHHTDKTFLSCHFYLSPPPAFYLPENSFTRLRDLQEILSRHSRPPFSLSKMDPDWEILVLGPCSRISRVKGFHCEGDILISPGALSLNTHAP